MASALEGQAGDDNSPPLLDANEPTNEISSGPRKAEVDEFALIPSQPLYDVDPNLFGSCEVRAGF